jgi:integrase
MSVYFDRGKGRWRFSFNRVVGGRRHRATKLLAPGWSRLQAEAYDRAEGGRLYAEATGIARPRLSLAGAVQLYVDKKLPSQRAKKKAAQHIKQLAGFIKGAALEDVAGVAERYLEQRRGELAPATVRQRLSYLKAAVRYAYRKHGYGDRDHSDRILMPTVHNERQIYVRVPNVRKLLARIQDLEARAVFALAFWTGFRWISEILPRTTADLERRGREIWLKAGTTKNGTPRMAPVHPEARWALEQLPFERHWRDYYKEFEAARKAAGMRHVRAHDLRHSLASEIISSGGTLADVQGALHHESIASSKRYAHLYPERVRRVILGVGKKNAHRRGTKNAA